MKRLHTAVRVGALLAILILAACAARQPAPAKLLQQTDTPNDASEFLEDIEHKTFGKDGFDDASEKIAAIEASLGITLTGMMSPPPPAKK